MQEKQQIVVCLFIRFLFFSFIPEKAFFQVIHTIEAYPLGDAQCKVENWVIHLDLKSLKYFVEDFSKRCPLY